MLVEKSFDTGKVVLNYVEGPDNGPPLVLLHGQNSRWQEFLPIMPSLIMRWHVYALDNRGAGKSGRVSGGYRIMDYISDVKTFLVENLDEPTVFFGRSMGSLLATWQAANLPDKVLALILGDLPIRIRRLIPMMNTEGNKQRNKERQSLYGRPEEEIISLLRDSVSPAAIRYQATTLSQFDPEMLYYQVEGDYEGWIEGYDGEALLRRVSCPVLLLQGDASCGSLLDDDEVEYISNTLPDVTHVKIEGVGHDLGLGSTWNASLLKQAVMNFLESLR